MARMPIPTDEDRVGRTIASTWRVEQILSRAGGFGVVYQGVHLRTGRPVAIKFLRHDVVGDDMRERFIREAQIIAKLDYPHIVQVLDVGDHDELGLYQVLELLRGRTLTARLEASPGERLSVPDCTRILVPVMEALAVTHRRAVVHRDVKPGNIFLHRDDDGQEIPKVLDFGIAKSLTTPKALGTTVGRLVGSVQYMAPEQLKGEADPRTDVWAVGVVWYECLAGVRPFDGDTIPDVFDAIRRQDPTPLREHLATVPTELADAVHRALQKDPKARFASMGEFIARVRAARVDMSADPEAPTRPIRANGSEAPDAPTLPWQRRATEVRAPARAWRVGAVGALTGVLLGYGVFRASHACPTILTASSLAALRVEDASVREPRVAQESESAAVTQGTSVSFDHRGDASSVRETPSRDGAVRSRPRQQVSSAEIGAFTPPDAGGFARPDAGNTTDRPRMTF